MGTALTLSSPVGYKNGSAQTSGPFVGFQYSDGDIPHVLRYSFTTPAGMYITTLRLTTTLRYYSGTTGYTRPIRVKVTQSATSHINAGASADYDAEYSYSVTTESTSATITISGLMLEPGTVYYLYLFPGSGYKNDGSSGHGQYLVFCYDNSGNDLTALEYNSIVNFYTLTTSAGTGSTITVKRTSSPNAGASTGTLSSGATIYTGDKLTIIFGANTGYTLATNTVTGATSNGNNIYTVSGNVKVVSSATVNSYTLTIGSGTGYTITVNRTSSKYGGGSTGVLSNGTIYYGDTLTITFTASTGYTLNTRTVNSTSVTSNTYTCTVKDNVSVAATVAVNMYILYINEGTGCTITVKRTSSPNKGAGTGNLSNGNYIYYGDVLTIKFKALEAYELVTNIVNGSDFSSGSSYTVTTSDVTVAATAKLMGLVYVYDGKDLTKFLVYVYDGKAWMQYMPYVYSDSGWVICS